MATIIYIQWEDSTKAKAVAVPDPASVAKKSCVIFINNLDLDINITGAAGLFPNLGTNPLPVAKDGGINAAAVSAAAASGKTFSFNDGTGGTAPRQGTIVVT